jgi:hypothetical protein
LVRQKKSFEGGESEINTARTDSELNKKIEGIGNTITPCSSILDDLEPKELNTNTMNLMDYYTPKYTIYLGLLASAAASI